MLLLFQHVNERRNSSFFLSKAFMNKFFFNVLHIKTSLVWTMEHVVKADLVAYL